jgi:molybdate transport system ATP-binding protein
MLYATHSMDEVARIADQLVLLDRGTLAAAGVLSGRLDLPADRPSRRRRDPAGEIAGHDDAHSITRVAIGQAETLHSHIDLPTGHPVRLRVPARDVAIATQRPEGGASRTSSPAASPPSPTGPTALAVRRCSRCLPPIPRDATTCRLDNRCSR